MRHLKLFESFLIQEAANTNLELKSIFRKLIEELRKDPPKGPGLKVKFEIKKFGSESEFAKYIPSKNLYDGENYNAYLVMDDDDRPSGGGSTKLFFSPFMDREKCKSYVQNVKDLIENQRYEEGKGAKVYGDILDAEVLNLIRGGIGLLIKPKNSIHKSKWEHFTDANKFRGLKRTPEENGISYLFGSGFGYISNNDLDKNKEYSLIKIDSNSKKIEVNRALSQELATGDRRNKLVKIAKQFAEENGYQYVAITDSFK
jgi:hypothetical protein